MGCEIRCGAGGDRCEAAGMSLHGLEHEGHVHHHAHAHDHVHARAHDRRRLIATLVLSGLILVAEVVGGIVSGSLALLSDAGHVLADMSAQVISLVALLIASRPATQKRTYGYYRLEILAALVNGVILLALAAWVIYTAASRLGAGVPGEVHAHLMLPVAVIGLLANLAGAWLLHGAHTLNARGAYLHVLSDALASVAVVAGGIAILVEPRLTFLDPILGIVIAGIVVVGAFRLLREATDVLLEAAPVDIDTDRVRRDVEQLSGIANVHDLHIWTITSGLHALSAHIVIEDGQGGDEVLCRVKELLARDHSISHSTLQIESTAYERHAH
jgi:cobalt-zinc-cadmium efflux system protein